MTVAVRKMDEAEAQKIRKSASDRRSRPYLIFSLVFLTLIVFGLSVWVIYLHLWSTKCSEDNTTASPAKDAKTDPVFYEDKNYRGRYYLAPPDWQKSWCVNLPPWANNMPMSVKPGEHCVKVFDNQHCRDLLGHIHPQSFGQDDLKRIDLDGRISAFSRC